MATKAVKILDKNFHISLKLNDLPISVAVGLCLDQGMRFLHSLKYVFSELVNYVYLYY